MRWCQAALDLVKGATHTALTSVQNVRVDHRRRHVPVPEQFLDGANVVSNLQHVGGEGVAQDVR